MFSFPITNKLLKIPVFEKLARQAVVNLTWNVAFTVIKYCIEQGQRGPCCFCPSVHNSCSVLSWMVKPRCYLPLFFFPWGGGCCIEMSLARGNHLGLSKVQRMLPLQRLKGSRRMWVWEAVQLSRSFWSHECWHVGVWLQMNSGLSLIKMSERLAASHVLRDSCQTCHRWLCIYTGAALGATRVKKTYTLI